MRWHKKKLRVINATRRTLLGEHIRVAETGLTRIVGLLGESELLPGDGLLIVPSQSIHTWGMRFPIDIAVLDDEWKVIAVRPALRPFRMTRLFWKAAAVLELPSGRLHSTSTRVGDTMELRPADATSQSVQV
jgi:hypothetical protein